MIINMKGAGGMLFGTGSLLNVGGLKSVMERQERREKSEREIAFYEKQKENLKNKECDTLEEIERKLEMLHTYEDEIAAVKASYNREEMFHILDEAKEQGEKNAEAAKKSEPKTPEERKKELAEEALGLDEEKGALTEAMEELAQAVEEITDAADAVEAVTKDNVTEENIAGGNTADQAVDMTKKEMGIEQPVGQTAEEILAERKETWEVQEAEALEKQAMQYKRFDARI